MSLLKRLEKDNSSKEETRTPKGPWVFSLDNAKEIAESMEVRVSPQVRYENIPFDILLSAEERVRFSELPKDKLDELNRARRKNLEQYSEVNELWRRFFEEKATEAEIRLLCKTVGTECIKTAIRYFNQFAEKWQKEYGFSLSPADSDSTDLDQTDSSIADESIIPELEAEDRKNKARFLERRKIHLDNYREYKNQLNNTSGAELGIQNARLAVKELVSRLNDYFSKGKNIQDHLGKDMADIISNWAEIRAKYMGDRVRAGAKVNERYGYNKIEFTAALVEAPPFGYKYMNEILDVLEQLEDRFFRGYEG